MYQKQIDESAIVLTGAIKAKKLLILALACVAGVVVCLMMELWRAAFHRQKEKIKSKIRSRR